MGDVNQAVKQAVDTIEALNVETAEGCLFPGKIVEYADRIRKLYKTLTFDHRPFLHPNEYDFTLKNTEHYRIGHVCFKMAVAQILEPELICEIGISSGTSALAFLEGAPDATYVGIDNGGDAGRLGIDLTLHAEEQLTKKGYHKWGFRIQNSLSINYLESFNLFHVDANHEWKHCFHDVLLGLASQSEWILVDDARDSQVAGATLDAMFKHHPGSCEWAFFEDTWTGNILIHNRPGARP
jgi:hypothetical protein